MDVVTVIANQTSVLKVRKRKQKIPLQDIKHYMSGFRPKQY